MAKAHKLDGTGLGLDTALSVADLRTICLTAATQATGTLWKGQERITLVRESDDLLVFEMPALLKLIKRMVFSVAITEQNGRRQLLTTINDYLTTRWMLWGIIPMGPSEMTGHYVYVEYLELVANTVQSADPSTVARLELGAHQRASIPSVRPYAVPSREAAPPAGPAPAVSPTLSLAKVEPGVEAEVAIEAEPEAELDRTVVVERRTRKLHWVLEAADGAVVDIDGDRRIVLGRDPRTVDQNVTTVPVAGDDQSVSASHALVEVSEGRLIVTDLGSTNGTVVLDAQGRERACVPGEAVEVATDSVIELGAYTLKARTQMRRAR